MAGKLHVVATPIGNLRDITFRAVDTLKKSSVIIAEDTRITAGLCTHYGISARIISNHSFNERHRVEEVMEILKSGSEVSLVSDAGTPLLSDPGFILVDACIKSNIAVEAVPGASSITAALCLSGFDPSRFLFMGFLERKGAAKKEELLKIKSYGMPVVIFESPARVRQTLGVALEAAGDIDAAVVKEMTKMYEKVFRGKISRILEEMPEEPKGEHVIVLNPPEACRPEPSDDEVCEAIEKHIKMGESKSSAVKKAALELDISKNRAYNIAHKEE